MFAAAAPDSSVTLQLFAIVLAITLGAAKVHGRMVWQRQTDLRRHPARNARLTAAALAVVSGAALTVGLVVTTDARPPIPRGEVQQVVDPLTGRSAATFVLVDRVPGRRERPAPLSYSGASY